MNAFGGPCDYSPLTNRGAQVTEAWFCGSGTTG
jgi:hypothetical protein